MCNEGEVLGYAPEIMMAKGRMHIACRRRLPYLRAYSYWLSCLECTIDAYHHVGRYACMYDRTDGAAKCCRLMWCGVQSATRTWEYAHEDAHTL